MSDHSPLPGDRLAKVIARAGLCSRRDAEAMIREGRVRVNGKKIDSPALNVTAEDHVVVDGKPLPEAERSRLFRYYKPRGLLTSARDPQGRPTVFENLPAGLPRLISVGRLDFNSEGLLLLTNDGALARKLELPSMGWVRRYRVRLYGKADLESLRKLANGIVIDGQRYGPIQTEIDSQKGDNAWITMSLTEGKNREIRKICAHFGWPVSRLIRVAYGPFQLGNMQKGDIEEVPAKVMREQLGGTPTKKKAHSKNHAPAKSNAKKKRDRLPAKSHAD